jgi:nicotinate-nucleotide--dimethylbenzimidazole phosphoribosyltransferase
MHGAIEEAAAAIFPPDEAARDEARALQKRLTKPAGALGRLEELHAWAAGIFRDAQPAPPRKSIVVAAADHGVAAAGVSTYPTDVTAQMVANFLSGGAAVSVLAAHAGADVRVIDAGVAQDNGDPRLYAAKLSRGTADMTHGPAMSRAEAEALIGRGIAFAGSLAAGGGGPLAIGLGDMGIGNTTAAAAVTSVMTGLPPRVTAGRGTGIDDETFARKVDAIERAIAINAPEPADPVGVIAGVGGCELAFLAGVTIGAAANRAAVVVDGYPTTAAVLVAAAIAPGCIDYTLASHLSAEPGHRFALDALGLRPLLDLDLRLGEGTGAALAMTLLDAALRLPREMATFDSAGVSRASVELRPEA